MVKIRSYWELYEKYVVLDPDEHSSTYIILNGDHATKPRQVRSLLETVTQVALSEGLLYSAIMGRRHVPLILINGTCRQIARFGHRMHALLHEDVSAR